MPVDRPIILVTGAARSGKSEWAETLARRTQQPVIYIATSRIEAQDGEWQSRVQQHRLRRPSHWQTLEIPLELSSAIENSPYPSCLLIDSLGTWVANGLEITATDWEKISTDLLHSLKTASVSIILVSEETGWGVIPAYESGRLFRDRLGSLTRRIGMMADRVYLVTGGHALDLRQLGQRLDEGEGIRPPD